MQAWMGDQVRVSVKVLTDEGRQTESNCDKCKTDNRKGVDCVQNVQHTRTHTHILALFAWTKPRQIAECKGSMGFEKRSSKSRALPEIQTMFLRSRIVRWSNVIATSATDFAHAVVLGTQRQAAEALVARGK